MDWARILAFVTGMTDQELLGRNEYLVAENRILKAKLKGRLKLADAERATLGKIGHRLGRKVLGEVANTARPDTILAWYRKLVARKFDGSKARRSLGRPRIKREIEQLIVRLAKENRDWGYDRIAGITVHPDERWMQQIARNVTMEGCGALRDCRYLLHDRDTKYTQSFRAIIASGRVEPLMLPACSPNLNAYAERWVRSVKEECLCKVILFGDRSLRRALNEYVEHFHAERNHQGKGNVLLFPRSANTRREGHVQCRERLGGLLRYYHQEAAYRHARKMTSQTETNSENNTDKGRAAGTAYVAAHRRAGRVAESI